MESCLGEESFQMWELNRRLEVYLSRVKALEEQNELLSAELGGLRAQSSDASWRARAEDELAALRALVDQRWREKHAAEVARDNLAEELESVAGRCQQQRLAREQAAEETARSRRAVEAEKCAQTWLSNQAADLERELDALRAAHEEERACLNAQAACTPRRPAPPRAPPAPAPEVEELAERLGEAWRGAVRGYQERVAHMETSLGQARERLGRAMQGAREGRLELQQLQAERGGLQERRAALEQRLEGRWQERLRATERFQLAVEALEQEKQGLQNQIAQVLEGRQQLAHLKMSLSLEVATYRTLLEAENTRLQTPGSSSKASLSFQDSKPEMHFPGISEGRHLGPILPVLSPTSLTSPLPDTPRTPIPVFPKRQEFLQACTPTLASTPISPTPRAPFPATHTEIRVQEAPVSLLQSHGGKPQAAECLWAEAEVAIPASILPGPEEPGGKQQEASPGQSPEDPVSLAPPHNRDHCSLEANDGELSGSGMSSIPQEEGEGQMRGLIEEETTVEVKVGSSLQQDTWQEEGDVSREEIQKPQTLLEKETLKSLEEKIEEPLMSLGKQSQETLRSLEKENHDSLTSLEEEKLDTLNLEIPKTLEKENQELQESAEEKSLEVVRSSETETVEPLTPIAKEEPQALQSVEKKSQEHLKPLDDNLETFLFLGKENQEELLRSLEEENLGSLRALEKESQEPLKSPEVEDQEALRPLAKANQEPVRSQEIENQETLRLLEKENEDPLKSLKNENQETLRALEKENQKSLKYLENENRDILENMDQEPVGSQEEKQKTWRSLEKQTEEPLDSLGKDDLKMLKPVEKETQEPLGSLKEDSVEKMESLELENPESLKFAEEEALGIRKSPEAQEPLWCLEEKNQETMKALEKKIQEPLGTMEETQETLKLLEKENPEALRALGEWDLENLKSSEEVDKESQRHLEEEGTLEKGENEDSLRSLKDEGQGLSLSADQQRWEVAVGAEQELSEDLQPGRDEVEYEDEAELELREQDGLSGKEEVVGQGQLWLSAAGEAWNTGEGHSGRPEPEEQRAPVEGAKGEGGTEGLHNPEGQPDLVGAPGRGAPQGMLEVVGPMLKDKDMAPGSDPASLQVTLRSEIATGESAVQAEEGLEQEAVKVEDPGHLEREEVMKPLLGKEDLEAKKGNGLEKPGKDLQEGDAKAGELSKLPSESTDPQNPQESEGWEESESEAISETEEGLPPEPLCLNGTDASQPKREEDARPVPGTPSPRPTEPWVPTSLPEDGPGPQPQTESNQVASWGLEGSMEAPGKEEGEQESGSVGIPEGLQEEEEESREESEADELGETLPDSTPLVLFPGSPASFKWGPDEEERPSPQGEARQEGWDTTVQSSEVLGAHPSEEEQQDEEVGPSHDSDLSEEFEDLGTEASLLPGVPGEVAEPLGQVPQLLLEPAVWDRDEESDGFADEEESGEEEGEGNDEEEEGRRPGAGQWGPGSFVGNLQTLSDPQRVDLVESETVEVNAPITALETESQDSAEPSGSEEESDLVPLERQDKVSGPLEIPSGLEDAGHQGPGETLGVNGQGPSWEEESEHLNGRLVTRLEQSDEGGQGKMGATEADRDSPLEVEEGGSLKAPWAGVPLRLGQSQFLKFTQREGDGDSWSSGED